MFHKNRDTPFRSQKSTSPIGSSPHQGLSPSLPSSPGTPQHHQVEVRLFQRHPQYLTPPPPLEKNHRDSQVNIFDYDTNAEPFLASTSANRTLALSMASYANCLPRPSSAKIYFPQPTRDNTSPQTALLKGRSASATAAAVSMKRERPTFCREEIIEERDPVSNVVLNRYCVVGLLGSGGFGKVYQFVELKSKAHYACKVVKIVPGKEIVKSEIEVQRRMRHNNIVRLYHTFKDEYYTYILLELCTPKNLLDILGKRKFPEAEIAGIMSQLVNAVEYMHHHHVIHRDLKLGNIFVDLEGNVKVGDFGFATYCDPVNERHTKLCGTPNYIAPEILEASESNTGYGFEVDIWSLGIILYTLTVGTPPFQRKDVNSTYECIRQMKYGIPESVSPACRELITSMLQRDPKRRPTPAQIRESRFLNSGCVFIPKRLKSIDSVYFRTSPMAATSPISEYPHVFTPQSSEVRTTRLRMPEARSNKLAPPAAFVQSCVYYNKYGYAFLLHCGERVATTCFLNDRTKLVLNQEKDEMQYYARVSDHNRVFHDDLFSFQNLREYFYGDGVTSEANPNLNSAIFAAAKKKWCIANFFIPLLKGTEEYPFCRSGIPIDLSTESELFLKSAPGASPSNFYYVKECTYLDFGEATGMGGVPNDIRAFAMKFLDGSYQVTVNSRGPAAREYTPNMPDCLVPRQEEWKLDLVHYGDRHTFLVLETEQSKVCSTIFDITTDWERCEGGKMYAVHNSTNLRCRHVFLPMGLIQCIGQAIQKLKNSSDIEQIYSI